MNAFLQGMLGKRENESSFERSTASSNKENRENESSRLVWAKTLGVSAPSLKIKSLSNSFDANSVAEEKKFQRYSSPSTRVPVMFGPPLEMSDLESVIREFEKKFLTPVNDANANCKKEGNFVKRIVAAFEDKCRSYDQSRSAKERIQRRSFDNRNQSTECNRERGKQGSAKVVCKENDVKVEVLCSTPKEKQKNTWMSIFASPFKHSPCYEKDKQRDGRRREENLSSSFELGESYTNFGEKQLEETDRIEDWSFVEVGKSHFVEEEREHEGGEDEKGSRGSSPFKALDDENKSIESIDLSDALEIEDITIMEEEEEVEIKEEIKVRVESGKKIKEKVAKVNNNAKVQEKLTKEEDIFEIPRTRRKVPTSPRIVGAFLKKPIEVERTAVDWIPIIGKKLPRKKSFKKLLSILTRKKSCEKRRQKILFASERNVSEEPREFQDSGYEEKSSSSSSLKSLVSVSEVILQQMDEEKRRPDNGRKAATLKTFRAKNFFHRAEYVCQRNSVDLAKVQVELQVQLRERLMEQQRQKKNPNSRQLRLSEVPRETIAQDLGPYHLNKDCDLTMSLDRRLQLGKSSSRVGNRRSVLTKLPKHPFLSGIPKHPFVSTSIMDNCEENSNKVCNFVESFSQKQTHPNLPPTCTQSSPVLTESNYDVPRRHRFSKSDSKIHEIAKNQSTFQNFAQGQQHVYDVPKCGSLERPLSSNYEDIMAFERKNNNALFSNRCVLPDFYGKSKEEEEPHYATVRRGPIRAQGSYLILKSSEDLANFEQTSVL